MPGYNRAGPSLNGIAGMHDKLTPELSSSAVVAIDVGNASIALGAWDQMMVRFSRRVPTGARDRFFAELKTLCTRFPGGRPQAVVVASVVPQALPWVREAATELANRETAVVGQSVPLPIPVAVREPQRVGVDRVCAAAAAFDRTAHACTVIDFGTAVTVDLVDDAGTFLGGAILPGAHLQASALARGTAALPEVDPAPPENPVGADTVEAICSGICHGIPGAVRAIVEQYATSLNHWPQVVATGGELELFLPQCDFIDSSVPDLTVLGVGLAYAKHRPATSKP